MLQSIRSVFLGILLALVVGTLVIRGIVAPVFDAFLGAQLAQTALPSVVVVFGAAFAFYFGGMVASYKAPSRRRLHGVLVGVVSFALSPLLNFGAAAFSLGGDPFANLRTPGAALLTVVLLVAILAASYVGARRGEALHVHNQAVIRRQRSRKAREKLSEGEPQQQGAVDGTDARQG